jgi:hypothetical protein
MTALIPQACGGNRSADFTAATHTDYGRAAQAFREKISAGAR